MAPPETQSGPGPSFAAQEPVAAGAPAAGSTRDAWPRAVLHLDMDAFFASVHVLVHPEDAGVPLVVGGLPSERGVVAAASYEARAYGIHSAMPTRTAVRLCPELKIVGHDWVRIQEISRKVMAILGEYGALEPMSVDEAYVDLAGHAAPEPMAARIRDRVRAETGLSASVGLATSKLVAKVASDREKPGGCTVVRPGTEASFLAPLPVRALHGVGPKTEERLAKLGITTCAELAASDAEELARGGLGRYGEVLVAMAKGRDERPVGPTRAARRSVSSETTFSRDEGERAVLEATIVDLARGVARRLDRHQLVARTVVVKFRWSDFTTFTRQRTPDHVLAGEDELAAAALDVFRAHWPKGRRVRLLGVGAANVVAGAERQLGLWD